MAGSDRIESAVNSHDEERAGDTTSVPELRRDVQILQSLRRIVRAVELYSHRLKSQHNLTVPQLVCLSAVANNEKATVSEIARSAYLSASTVVGILDRLEKRGLVSRQRSRDDRRVVHVLSTAAGRKLVKRAPSALHEEFAQALGRLSESEQAAIATALHKVVDLMEVGHLEVDPILEPKSDFTEGNDQL